MTKLADAFRLLCLFALKCAGRFPRLYARALHTEIGFSGHVSLIDADIAEQRHLKPLTRFEHWLLAPLIEADREIRRRAFRDVISDYRGETSC